MIPTSRHRYRMRSAPGRWGWLLMGLAGLALFGFLLSRADRLPGPVGAAIRHNRVTGRDAGALFYTDVEHLPARFFQLRPRHPDLLPITLLERTTVAALRCQNRRPRRDLLLA